jgi:hypothetical protein
MPHDSGQLIGSASQAFLEQVESTPLPLTTIDKAQAYAVCATVEAYNGNTTGAYGILHWFEDYLEGSTEPQPREVSRILNRARARIASTTADRQPRRQTDDPLEPQRTRFTVPGITRRHR